MEDDDDLRETIAVVLSFHGYEVDAVASVAAAHHQLSKSRPNAIVVDALLGGESARGLLEAIARDGDHPPTLIVSGSPGAEKLAHDFSFPLLPKPFDVDELIDEVARMHRA